jgi:beta-glucosidase
LIWASVALLSCAATTAQTKLPPYKNQKLSIEKRASDLLSRMTLEEKVAQLECKISYTKDKPYADSNGLGGLATVLRSMDPKEAAVQANVIQKFALEQTRPGIPVIIHDEAVHGVMAKGATSFPQAIGLAATWDTALVAQVAEIISQETKARGIRQVLSPVVNLARDVRWGRVEETYGEDPFLSARMGATFCRTLEENQVITTPKHFVVNVGDGGRDSFPISETERELLEYDFVPFIACFTEGHATSVMAAYNSYDGVPCSANHWLLTDMLRDTWGFKGFVVSDYGSVSGIYDMHHTATTEEEAAHQAIDAGLDVEFPDVYIYGKPLIKAVKDGLVKEKTLDLAVRRVLEAKFRIGLFDNLYVDTNAVEGVTNTAGHRQKALQAAREAIVLLKNENHILPLSKDITSIAVIGPNANVVRLGGYSAEGMNVVTVLQGIKNKLSERTTVNYAQGCNIGGTSLPPIPFESLIPSDTTLGKHGLKGEYFNSIDLSGAPAMIRLDSIIDFGWGEGSPDPKIHSDSFSVRWTGKIVAPATRKYKISVTSDDGVRLWLDGKLMVDSWFDRGETADYFTMSMEAEKSYDVKIEYYEDLGDAAARLGWNSFDMVKKGIDEAVDAAKKSSVAVIVTGILEGEGNDRADLGLTGPQEDLIKAVTDTKVPTIVVLMAGSAVTMDQWIAKVPGIIEMWYGGEEGGNALAEALFGDYNPGGRLPVTFPQTVGQVPLYYDHKPTGRGNDYVLLSGKPQFAFGYGLSYTSFSYANLKIDSPNPYTEGTIHVSVDITNTGAVKGDEVAQLYIHDSTATVTRPVLELKGFQRITLNPGETKTVTFPLTHQSLEYPGHDLKPVLESGCVDVLVGSTSDDIRARGRVFVGTATRKSKK